MTTGVSYQIEFAEAQAKARAAADYMLATLQEDVINKIAEVYDEAHRDKVLAAFKEQMEPQSPFHMTLESRILEALSKTYVFLPPKE